MIYLLVNTRYKWGFYSLVSQYRQNTISAIDDNGINIMVEFGTGPGLIPRLVCVLNALNLIVFMLCAN